MVLIVSVEAPLPLGVRVTGLGLKLLLVRAGRPLTLSVTLPLKLLSDVRLAP